MAQVKAELKFKGMETDRSPMSDKWLPGSYEYGLNIRVGSSEQSNVGAVENIKGNTLVSFAMENGTNKCIGSHEDIATNSVFYFIWNNAGRHGIYKYNALTNSISKIFPATHNVSDILHFGEFNLITGTGYVNSQLFWTDKINPPRKINIIDAPSYNADYIEAFIDLIKIPPTVPMSASSRWLDNAGGVSAFTITPTAANAMANFSYQFIHRYIWKDGERSVWSAPTQLIPTGYAGELKNSILLTISNAETANATHFSKVISYIEIGFRDGNSTIEGDAVPYKLATRIAFPTSNGNVTFDFRHDQSYTVIDPLQTAKYFDSVPLYSGALALNKNRIFLGDNIEGFDVPQTFVAAMTVYPFTWSKSFVSSVPPMNNRQYYLSGSKYSVGVVFYDRADRKSGVQYLYSFNTDERHGGFAPNTSQFFLRGTPPVWATHYHIVRTSSRNKSYFIQAVVDIISQGSDLVVFKLSKGNSSNVAYNFTPGDKCNLISYKAGSAGLASAQDNLQVVGQTGANITVKWTPGANIGDFVLVSGCMVELYSPIPTAHIDQYYEIGQEYPVINPGLSNRLFGNDTSNDPSDYGKLILLGDGVSDKSGDIHYRDITKPAEAIAGVYPFKTFAIVAVKSQVKSSENPDPILVIKYDLYVNGIIYTYTGDQQNYRQPSTPIDVVKALSQLVNADVANNLSTFSYTPPPPGSPGDTEVHFTITSNTRGDLLFTTNINSYPIVGYTTDKADNSGVPIAELSPVQAVANDSGNNIEAMAANDDFYENWQKNIGRPNIRFLETEKQVERLTQIRFGGEFIQDTQINNLMSFDSFNQKVLPIEFGTLTKLQPAANIQSEGSVLLSIHTNEIASLYIGEVTFKQAGGSQTVGLSSEVIGSVNPMAKGLGSMNPESVKQFNGNVYGFDMLRGVVWRYAQDGLTEISSAGKRTFFFQKSQELLSQSNIKVFGAIDPYHNEYILTMPGSDATLRTLAWSENENQWTTYYSFIGENYSRVNTRLVSFKNGALWLHNSNATRNNFYGAQYTSRIKVVCNQEYLAMKILERIEQLPGKDLWNATDIGTPEGQSSELIGLRNPLTTYTPPQDWNRFENSISGNVMRDKNTPNETYPLLNGDYIRSQIFTALLECSATTPTVLSIVNMYYIYSNRTNR